MKLYSANSARRSLLDTIGFRALSQLATVVSYMLLVRGMAEREFGIYSLLYSFIPIVITLGSLGLDHTLRRFQPEYLRNAQYGLERWLVSIVRRVRFGSNIVIVLGIFLAWHWIAPRFGLQSYRSDFAVFAVFMIVYFQVNILQFSLASQMLHRYSVGSVAVMSAGKLAAYFVLSQFQALSLLNAILADLFAYALAFAFLTVAHRQAQKQHPAPVEKPAADEFRRLRRYAGFMHFTDATSLLTYAETDRFFIAAMLNPLAVGAYAFYSRLNEMISNLVPLKYFDNVVQPLFFGVPREESKDRIPKYFTLLMNLNWVYQFPVIVLTFVYHREIVNLIFAGKFIEHSALLPLIVAFGASDNVFSIPVTIVAQYKEKASIVLQSQVMGLYQVAAMLVLIPVVGLTGAGIATGTFHLFRNLFVWWRVRDVAIWINWRGALLSACAIWGSCGLLCFGLREFVELPAIVALACGILVCGVGTVLYIRSPAISESDRSILANILGGRESKALRLIGLLPKERGA